MEQKIHRWRKISVQVSMRGMLRPIRVDTLRRVHNAGFLVDRLIKWCQIDEAKTSHRKTLLEVCNSYSYCQNFTQCAFIPRSKYTFVLYLFKKQPLTSCFEAVHAKTYACQLLCRPQLYWPCFKLQILWSFCKIIHILIMSRINKQNVKHLKFKFSHIFSIFITETINLKRRSRSVFQYMSRLLFGQ